MSDSLASPWVNTASADKLFAALFEVSLSGAVLYTPVYDADGQLSDLTLAYLNPAAQRLLGLPPRPTTTYRQQFPDDPASGGWAFHRAAFLSGHTATAHLRYGGTSSFRVQAHRAEDTLLVSFSELLDNQFSPPAAPLDTASIDEPSSDPVLATPGTAEAKGGAAQPGAESELIEEGLRLAHERLVDVLESTTDAFYSLDADFCFTYVNQRAARLWGRDQHELLGRHYWTEFPGAVGSESYQKHYQVLETGQPVHYETVSPLLGTWIDTIIYPGRTGGLSVFFRDISARKQAEASLRESDAKLAAVVEALPVGIGVLDASGKLLFANAQMKRYLPTGVMPSRDETESKRWRAYYPDGRLLQPTDYPGARALRGEVIVPGTDMRFAQENGVEVWTQVSAVPLTDLAGHVTGHVTVVVDIEAWKRAEESLRASEERLRVLIENLPGGAVFVVDGQLRYQLAEGQALRQAGLTPADLLGRTVREVMPPELVDQHELNYRAALAGETFAVELETYGRSYITRGVPLRDATGQVEAALAVSYDITEQKQVEAALQRSEERLQQALSIDTVGVIFFDLQGNINDANAAFQRMSGFSREDFVSGRVRWDEITPAEFMEATHRSRYELLTGGQNTPYEKQYIRPDGSRWWGLFAGKRLSSGECVEFVLDITPRKEALRQLHESQQQLLAFNEQLRRANVDLDNFIYTASHDLKAPITNIEGLIHALQEQLPAEVQQTHDVGPLLGMMESSVQRFLRTIEHLSDVVKLQQAHAGPAVDVPLLPVIEDVRRDLRPQLAAVGAQVDLDVQECSVVSFAPQHLRSVVYNLLSNAVKYRHPDRIPRVRIACRQQDRYTVLSVEDNGLGLEPHKQGELFTMFRRFHTHVEGSGIGLYMVKRMVENVGGRVEVDSQPGLGSTFRVYFPR